MRFKTFIVVGGAFVASSFSAPTQFQPVGKADAADGVKAAQEAVTVPEFVPVINFSQFVLATEQFAETNRVSARGEAEALSAKFASASDPRHVDLHPVQQTPAIVESALSLPVSDPVERPVAPLADPVKVVTIAPEAPEAAAAEAQPQQTEADATETKSAAAERPTEKRFRPAMGLGMAAPDDEAALFPSSADRPKNSKKKTADRAANRRLATAAAPTMANSAKAPDGAYHGSTPKEAFQIGIPGQSMEPQISTCAKTERTCWGKLCGC